MQLEAAPVEVEVVFTEQPDQTASLRDVAERSDEVGVETELHGGIAVAPSPPGGTHMEIQWRKDVDDAIRDARDSGRPLLLDFSAAPM
jgi:hypothetical protein